MGAEEETITVGQRTYLCGEVTVRLEAEAVEPFHRRRICCTTILRAVHTIPTIPHCTDHTAHHTIIRWVDRCTILVGRHPPPSTW